jgi:protein TonB
MTALAMCPQDRRTWGLAGAAALAAHALAAAAILAWSRPAEPPVPEPVVLVELPAEAAAAVVASAVQPAQPSPPQQSLKPLAPTPPMDVPRVAAPLPVNPVTLPSPAPAQPVRAVAQPVAAAPAPPSAAPVSGAGAGSSALPGTDPRARKAEVDYFSLVSAYLNRRKTYPAEARKAREEGVVVLRFTVDRAGNVSGAAIKRGSGHDLLDRATLDLIQRVAPLPRMPDAMARQSVTLALPIEYALKTS